MISWISFTLLPASFNTAFNESIELSTKSSTKASNFARVTLIAKCLGPVASAVIYGRFTSVDCADESSIFAFSAASFTRCNAIGSLRKSTPCSFLNSSMM